MSRRSAAAVAALMLLASCHRPVPPPVVAHPHFVLGGAWRSGAVWFYPREAYAYRVTGIATREPPPAAPLATDGEVWSPQAMTGAHQTLQLPAIVRVRNLRNGRIVRIRLTERGPAAAGRIVALTPRAADLLGMTADTPVEIIEDEDASRRLAEALGAPQAVQVARAPVGEVQAQSLSDGTRQVFGGGASQAGASGTDPGPLPPVVTQGAVGPTGLYVLLGTFSSRAAAQRVAGRCGGTVRHVSGTAGLDWEARSGPYGAGGDLSQADRALDRTPSCGVEGARIDVE